MKSFEINKAKEFADELYTIIEMQVASGWCYDLAKILKEDIDGEAELVFAFKLLKNGKLRLSIKIY